MAAKQTSDSEPQVSGPSGVCERSEWTPEGA